METGYRLVLNDPDTLDSIAFDLMPEEVATEIPHLLHVVPLPRGFRHVESQGEGVGMVSIRGTFGQQVREYNGETRDGNEIYNYFERAFYQRYLFLKRTLPKNQQKRLKVEWHDWQRDRHHYCEVERFTNPRDESNRMYMEFALEIKLIEEIKPEKVVRPQPDRLTRATRALRDLDAQTERLKRFGQQIQNDRDRLLSQVSRTVFQPLNSITTALRSFVGGATSFVTLPLATLNTLGNGIDTTIANAGALTTAPLTDLVHELRQIRSTLYRLRRSPELFRDSIDGKLEELRDTFFEQETDDLSPVEKLAVQSGQNAQKRNLSSSITALSYQAGKRVRVKNNDNLQRIARREIGDATQWRVLAELNGLQFPYVSSAGEPNTIAPGQEILIPVPAQTETPEISQSFGDTTIATVEDRLYGVDFKTTFTSEGKVDRVWEGNDFVAVGGRDNLKQSIENRMVTTQGDLLEDADYGFPDNRGTKATQADYLFQKFRIEKSIESDSRIESATVTMDVRGNVANINYNITPKRGTTGRSVQGVVSV